MVESELGLTVPPDRQKYVALKGILAIAVFETECSFPYGH